MLNIRRAQERGHVQMGWLDTWHTFSFGSYYDPEHMGSSVLRVINDDRVAPHTGFGMHGHRNMEILTVMLAGTLTHKDSMGNEEQLTAGEYQLMSAGKGVMHSEVNQGDEPVHLLQIWLEPNEFNTTPGYRQQRLPDAEGLTLIASPDAANDSFFIRQNARVWRGKMTTSGTLDYSLAEGRSAWLHVIHGSVALDGQLLQPGDGAEITRKRTLQLTCTPDSDFLLFDMP